MTPEQFNTLRSTFPWTERVVQTAKQRGLVQVLDRNGVEVPLFTITAVLVFLTNRMAQPAAAPTTPNQETFP